MPYREEPPMTGDVIQGLMLSGDMFTEDINRLKIHLNRIAPVIGRFMIETPPPGFAPDEIRADWVGSDLPVRAIYRGGGIPILGTEAIHELAVGGKSDAAEWWRDYYAMEARLDFDKVDFDDHPEVIGNISFLVFDESCGSVH